MDPFTEERRDPSELVDRILADDPEAVDHWFRGEHPQVFKLCFGFLAEAEEAEDAAQDAMLQLLDQLDRWDTARPWRAWRNTIVLNHCRDRLRRREARGRAEARAVEAHLPARLPEPHESAERGEVREVLFASLSALSPREREAFVLRDLEGLPTAEVAGTLGVGESSVRSLLTLARRRLRGLLAERLPGLAPGGLDG